MKVRRHIGRWAGVLGILAGVWSCAPPPPPHSKPPSEIANLLSRLPDARYRASLVYARARGASHPLAVILDPRGGEKLSVLELSAMEFFTEDLGELGRKDLIARLDGIEGRRFGGRTLRYLERFSKWRLRTLHAVRGAHRIPHHRGPPPAVRAPRRDLGTGLLGVSASRLELRGQDQGGGVAPNPDFRRGARAVGDPDCGGRR